MKSITICHYSVISPVGKTDFGTSEHDAVTFQNQLLANGMTAQIKVTRTKQKL